MSEARAYHLYTAFFYCIGIAGVYLLVRTLSGSRGMAWLAAAATAVISPSYLFLVSWRADSIPLFPLRLTVLVRYGEGPHITSLALLPIALTASFWALREWRPRAMAAAAVFCALVFQITSTARRRWRSAFPFCCGVCGSRSRTGKCGYARRDYGVGVRAHRILACAIVLAVTTANLKLVSVPESVVDLGRVCRIGDLPFPYGEMGARQTRALLSGIRGRLRALLCGQCTRELLHRLSRRWRTAAAVPELDLALILLVAEGLRRLRNHDAVEWRALAVFILLISLAPALGYLRHPWLIMDVDPNYRDRVDSS